MVLKQLTDSHSGQHGFTTFKTYMVLKPEYMWQKRDGGFTTFKTYMVLKPSQLSALLAAASLPSKLTWFSNADKGV